MQEKKIQWLLQSAEYGISSTNVAHDINNALAILMGYTENIEYMAETDKLDKEEVIGACEKLFYAIDKLNLESKRIGADRKRPASEKRTANFADYFSKWTKIMNPQFQKHGIVASFQTGDELMVEANWSQVNEGLCEYFSEALESVKYETPTTIEFSTSVNEEGLCISFSKIEHWKEKPGAQFLGKDLNQAQTADSIELQFTCFPSPTAANSAA